MQVIWRPVYDSYCCLIHNTVIYKVMITMVSDIVLNNKIIINCSEFTITLYPLLPCELSHICQFDHEWLTVLGATLILDILTLVPSSLLFFTGGLTHTHEGYEWGMGITRNGHLSWVINPTQGCDTRNSIQSPRAQHDPCWYKVMSFLCTLVSHLTSSLAPCSFSHWPWRLHQMTQLPNCYFWHRDLLLQVNFNEAQHLEGSAGDISGRRIQDRTYFISVK